MDNDLVVSRWHTRIISNAESALGRKLTEIEHRFVASRGSFIGLEMIHDTVEELAYDPDGLSRYLNSEANID